MSGKKLLGAAVLAAAFMSFFGACKTDDNTPPAELRPGYPARYQVVPGWTNQTENVIAVVRADDPSTLAGYLPVLYAGRKGKSNNYIIYMGRIDNVPIGNLTRTMTYDGISPITISQGQSEITSTMVSNSVSTAISETTVTTTIQQRAATESLSFNFFVFGQTAQRTVQDAIAHSTMKGLSIENTETTAVTKSNSITDTISYTVGNNGEPAGRYRVMLFATVDVYLTVQLDDNPALLEKPEIVVCAREESYNYQLDYDPNITGDFARTGAGGMLPDPNDFDFTTLPPPQFNLRFVLAGSGYDIGKVAYSDNGLDWQEQEEEKSIEEWTESSIGAVNNWYGVAYGDNMFIAVGDNSSSPIVNMARSDDGVNWEPFSTVATASWNSVIYANGVFLATGTSQGSGIMAVRDSNNNWTTINRTAVPHGVVYGNNKWVVVGDSGSIASTTNFNSWDSYTVGGATTWNSIAYGPALMPFVAVGNSGKIAYFNSSSNWIDITVDTVNWNRVIYADGIYLAVGNSRGIGPESAGMMARSTNGRDWTPFSVGRSDWYDVTYCEELDLWVAAGRGFIAYSSNGINWFSVNEISFYRCVTYGER